MRASQKRVTVEPIEEHPNASYTFSEVLAQAELTQYLHAFQNNLGGERSEIRFLKVNACFCYCNGIPKECDLSARSESDSRISLAAKAFLLRFETSLVVWSWRRKQRIWRRKAKAKKQR